MKRLLSVMLIAILSISAVFAYPAWEWDPSVSIACDFTAEKGNFYFQQVGVYSAMTHCFGPGDCFFSKVRAGFTTDFNDSSLINGLRIDVMSGKYIELDALTETGWPVAFAITSAGLSTDLHLVNGKLKTNFAVLAEGQLVDGDVTDFATPSLDIRYVFANNTNVEPFTLSFGVEHELSFN